MGADPAELQREIAAQRRLIEGKVDALRQRIKGDVESAREDIRGMKDRLPGSNGHSTSEVEVHDDGEREPRPAASFSLDGIEVLGYDLGKLGLDERVGSHPMSSMAMAVGAGLILGMMNGSKEQRERDYRRSYRDDRRRGGGFFGPLMTALEDRTHDEIGRFVNQAADRIKHGQPGRAVEPEPQTRGQRHGNGHGAPPESVPREAPARIAN